MSRTCPSAAPAKAVELTLGTKNTTTNKYPLVVSVTSGQLLLGNGGVAAAMDATVTMDVPGFSNSLSGSLRLNTTGAAVTLGTSPNQVVVPADTVRVVLGKQGAKAALSVAGQSLSGIFSFEQLTVPPSANAAAGTPPTTEIRIAAQPGRADRRDRRRGCRAHRR